MMAISRVMQVSMQQVFPHGAFVVGEVSPVGDFDAGRRPDGSIPQALDRESGLPVWQVQVLDADPETSKRDKTVTVKIAAKVQPVPPPPVQGLPVAPVEFMGLTATPWVDKGAGDRPRLAWSLRAAGMCQPGKAAQQDGKAA